MWGESPVQKPDINDIFWEYMQEVASGIGWVKAKIIYDLSHNIESDEVQRLATVLQLLIKTNCAHKTMSLYELGCSMFKTKTRFISFLLSSATSSGDTIWLDMPLNEIEHEILNRLENI
jgi:hypothetical protein